MFLNSLNNKILILIDFIEHSSLFMAFFLTFVPNRIDIRYAFEEEEPEA